MKDQIKDRDLLWIIPLFCVVRLWFSVVELAFDVSEKFGRVKR